VVIEESKNITAENSTAYILGWLKKLKSDKKFIVMASGLAQKAVDYILDHQDSSFKPVLKIKKPQIVYTSISF
jgi:antirestriction protein ArdC